MSFCMIPSRNIASCVHILNNDQKKDRKNIRPGDPNTMANVFALSTPRIYKNVINYY